MRNILIVGDIHLPFEHKNYLDFCYRVKKDFRCEEVIFIGDLFDFHASSYHEHNPNLPSPSEELKMAKAKIKKWYDSFPKAMVCESNHDSILDRKAVTYGFPKDGITPFPKIAEFPDKWEYRFDYYIDGVRYFHGTGLSGNVPHKRAIEMNRISCVFGHLHTVAGVYYNATQKDILFSLAVGCGINIKSEAFNYAKNIISRPILGCGVVSYTNRGTNAQFVPMELR